MSARPTTRVKQPPAVVSPLRTLLTKAIEDCGYSHAEIALGAGLSRSTVSNALSGRARASIDTWDAMLAACEIELGTRRKRTR